MISHSQERSQTFSFGGPLEGPVLQQGELSMVCVGLQCSGMTSRGKFGGPLGGRQNFGGAVSPPGTPLAPPLVTASGVRRKFPRGIDKFRHNRVTSQSYDVTNQLLGKCRRHDLSGGVRGMPLENFAKLHLKIRIFVYSGSKF